MLRRRERCARREKIVKMQQRSNALDISVPNDDAGKTVKTTAGKMVGASEEKSVMHKCSFVALTALVAFAAAAAEPAKDEVKRKTIVYDVNDLLHRKGAHNGYDKIDDLVNLIVSGVETRLWKADGSDNRLVVLSATKLEITARKETHEQIEEILKMARRQMDLVVDLHGELIEVERAYYEKVIQPKLAKEPEGKRDRLLIDDELLGELRKKAVSARKNAVLVAPGQEDAVLTQREAFSYFPTEDTVGVGYHGAVLKAVVGVSADRRFVRLKLTRQIAELVEITQETATDAQGRQVTRESPNLNERAATLNVEVGDGLWVLTPVEYRRPGDKDKKTVRLALVQPTIIIGEELREKLRQLNASK
jgi:hypothetical protein